MAWLEKSEKEGIDAVIKDFFLINYGIERGTK